MHFIDFVLYLICLICWTLKSLYTFTFDYIIPVIGHILPLFAKYLSQLFSLLLRAFFMYVAPCIIQVVNGTTYLFTRLLNVISVASMTIIDSDVNLEYAHAVIVLSLIVIIIYFHITQKIFNFFYEWYQITSLYLRFIVNLLKMAHFCVKFISNKISARLFPHNDHPDDTKVTRKRRSYNGTMHNKSKEE